MESLSQTLSQVLNPTTALLIVASLFIFIGLITRRRRPPYPPGPRGWPIIGNMLMMDQLTHRGLANLAKKYGGLCHLRMGFLHMYAVSSPDVARQVLQVQDSVFSNRPATIAISYLTYDRADMAFAHYGPFWRQMRKVCVMKVFSRKRAESWASVRDEVDKMIRSVSSNVGKSVNVGEQIFALTRNITYRAAFGSACETGQDEFIRILQEFSKLFGAFNVADFIPYFGWIDPQGIKKRLVKARNDLDGFIDDIIDEHMKKKENQNAVDDGDVVDTDMVDDLLAFYSEEAKLVSDATDLQNSIKLTRDNIKAIIMDVMFGGTETVASAIEWALTELQMVKSTMMLLEKWEEMRNGEDEFELEIHRQIHSLSADILSRTAFGNSVEEGKQIFVLQERMMRLFYRVRWSVYIPGFRFFPTKTNREIWRIEKQIRGSILKLIEKNKTIALEKSGTLLQAFVSPYTNQNGQEERLGIEEVIDECKTFYFAAKETTGDLMTWVLVLLAMHQEWQNIAREEVIRVLGPTGFPTPEILQDLKTLTMIISETLRLYPPAMTLNRDTLKKAKLGNLEIPAGTQLYLSVIAMHHDTETWGSDAEEFNPRRFEDTRKQSALLVPFGLGPRTCVGQNLGVVEAKTVLATILRHYSFRLSPNYVHAPVLLVTLQPQNGAHFLFSRISS